MDVKTLCLGVLSAEDQTGYDIKRRGEEVFRHFFLAGFGSIYPALAELQREGLVTAQSVEQKKRPDKKIYSITPAGRAALVAELVATPPRHKVRSEFLALMYFAHLLPPERVDVVLGEMIDQFETMLVDELAHFDGEDAPEDLTPGQRFALGYGRTVLTAALAYCKRQRPQLARSLRGQPEDIGEASGDALPTDRSGIAEPTLASQRIPAATPVAGE